MTDAELIKTLRSSANRVVNYAADRIEQLTAERDRLRESLMDAREAWDNHMEYGEPMQGWWVADARAVLEGESYE